MEVNVEERGFLVSKHIISIFNHWLNLWKVLLIKITFHLEKVDLFDFKFNGLITSVGSCRKFLFFVLNES